MSAQNNIHLARTFYDAFNARELDRAAPVLSEDYELLNIPLGITFRGLEGYKQFQQGWATGFPNGKIELTNIVATDDQVVVEYVGRGTHNGPLSGPKGTIAATGRAVALSLVDVHHVKNGKIVRSRSYYDVLSLLQQLGQLPPVD